MLRGPLRRKRTRAHARVGGSGDSGKVGRVVAKWLLFLTWTSFPTTPPHSPLPPPYPCACAPPSLGLHHHVPFMFFFSRYSPLCLFHQLSEGQAPSRMAVAIA